MRKAHVRPRGWAQRFNIAILLGLCWACAWGCGLRVEAASAACPNEEFRTGASALLPDCRAYELVTPPSGTGRVYTLDSEAPFSMFPTSLLGPSADSAVFLIKGGALPELPEGTGTKDAYMAVRTASGWKVDRRLSPTGAQSVFPASGGISADHQYTFMAATGGSIGEFRGSLAEDGTATYLGDPDGSFELVGMGSLGTELRAHGRFISEGGEHVIFTTGYGEWCSFASCPANSLEPNAPPTGTTAVYDRGANGPTKVVSLLPGDVPLAAGEDAKYQGTSADGTVVAFKVAETLYLRVDNSETKLVTTDPTTFAGITQNGDALFYVSGGDVHKFSTATGATQAVTTTSNAELVNISSDGSHVYFISETALPGTAATPGSPNMYVWTSSDQATRFVATVLPADLEGLPALTTWTSHVVQPNRNFGQGPGANSSRTTPDGGVIVFESRAQLTSYENAGFVEIYRYDSGSEEIACVSCNPTAEPATGNARLEALEYFLTEFGGESIVVNNLSEDGGRVFFETKESLVGRDTDEVNDIYEWQTIGGLPQLSLISSGQSVFYSNEVPLQFQEPNVIFGISPDGSDVLFKTGDQLLPTGGAGGVDALYNARIGGGFAEPIDPCAQGICEGRPAVGAGLATPQSDSFRGYGNVKHRRHRCGAKKKSGKKKSAKRRSCRHGRGSSK